MNPRVRKMPAWYYGISARCPIDLTKDNPEKKRTRISGVRINTEKREVVQSHSTSTISDIENYSDEEWGDFVFIPVSDLVFCFYASSNKLIWSFDMHEVMLISL